MSRLPVTTHTALLMLVDAAAIFRMPARVEEYVAAMAYAAMLSLRQADAMPCHYAIIAMPWRFFSPLLILRC